MSQSIECSQIDRRHEGCRVRDSAREARLLAEVSQRGIQQALAGVWNDSRFILLDGFKRLRVADKLHIRQVAWRSLGDEEAMGILGLMRTKKQTALNAFEEARFIELLVDTHQMSIADIAAQLGRSKAWVSMRRGLLTEMTPAVQDLLGQGKFPIYAYMHTLRPFMRMNAADSGQIEQFIRGLAQQSPSLRDIQLLADGCFRGPAKLKEAILQGNWRWSLQQIKDTLAQPTACSAVEQQLLGDLMKTSKMMALITSRCHNASLETPAFLVEANLSATALLAQLPAFQQALETLDGRP